MLFLIKLWFLLFDVAGEGEGEGSGAGQEGSPEGSGQESSPGAGEGNADPKYGEFGETPTVDQLFEHIQSRGGEFEKLQKDSENYKGKLTANEKNISAIRKALETNGLKYLTDEEGNVTLSVAEQAKEERKIRFTDDHKKLFDPKVMEGIQGLIEDLLDSRFDEYSKGSEKRFETHYGGRAKKLSQYSSAKAEAQHQARGLFPNVWDKNPDGSENPDYNEEFYNLATKIYDESESFKKAPDGELRAMMKAALELGVTASGKKVIVNAEKKGFKKAQEGKKILGKVGSKAKGKAVVPDELSKADYFKLSPEDRAAYDKKNVGIEA